MKAVTEINSIKEALKSSELFHNLTDDELDKLLPLCQEQFYEPGAVMFCEGEQCNYVQTLKSGKVALETELAISHSSVEKATIDALSPGASFCWSALMEPHILTSSGRCLEKTEIIALDGNKLKALLNEDPQMGYKVACNLVRVVASRLEHTKQTMERILSIIFHDLKAPLAAAESYNRLLLDGFVGELSEEQKNIIKRSSKRLSDLLNLISNMIDLSRVDFGGFRTEEVSLTKVIEDCVETMRPLAVEKGLQLVFEAPPELPMILGSASRLKQVVTNLLSNAIKFTRSGGITVKVKDNKDNLQVDVIDSGIGIPSEDLPKIFDGFYKSKSINVEGRETGLGLSISKRIIEGHGGKIWATSPCPETGKGSKFTFILPKKSEPNGDKLDGEDFNSG
ncbi:MAG: cyclic nucleotide-binding domain-containing protein [Dehalococcoidia bacterium]|nr:cyclic nucleotide-binding domain-containing protein [Dehalococcoidia bacterium]